MEHSTSATFGEWGKRKDRGEGDYEPPGYTDKELEELLGEGGASDHPPGSAFFTVRLMEPERALVLYSDSHLRFMVPRSDRENPRYGIYGEFSWTFVLEEKRERNTRLIVRTRDNYGPRFYRALTMPFVLVGGEFFTTRKMLYSIKRRADQAAELTTTQPPSHPTS